MAVPENLKKGMLIRHKGDVYYVEDYYEGKSAQQKGTLHVKLRNVRTRQAVEVAANALGKIELAHSDHRMMQYLYAKGQEHVFMDEKTFDQVSLPADILKSELPFLVPEKEYRVLFLDDRPVMLELPPTISLKVTVTAPPQHGVGGSSVYKEAKLESGVTVMVPLFVKVGDVIRVSWASREYVGKES